MFRDKKIIAVCITKIQSVAMTNILRLVHDEAKKNDIKLIIFNSYVDYFYHDEYDEGAKAVYELINYDYVDGVLILDDCFYDKGVVDHIIAGAREHNRPVCLVNRVKEDCCCIMNNGDEALRSVISHVIKDHHVQKDLFFIAGNRYNDPASEARVNVFREVLEANDIPFDEDTMVGYGEYWADPTKALMKKLIEERAQLPKAVFCANDTMAIAASEYLQENGLRIPEDVIVTGFDGLPVTQRFHPHITTCREDMAQEAFVAISSLVRAINGEDINGVISIPYLPVITQSCGCVETRVHDYEQQVSFLHELFDDNEAHEDYIFSWLENMMEQSDINRLYDSIKDCIIEDSFMCINEDFLTHVTDYNGQGNISLSPNVRVVDARNTHLVKEPLHTMPVSQMIPYMENWINDDTLFILSTVYVGDMVCGYYGVCEDRLTADNRKIKRVSMSINLLFSEILSRAMQHNIKKSLEKSSFVHPISQLPNLKGATKWFGAFAADPVNHLHALSVSIYALPTYSYLYEHYGMNDIEETIKYTAASLVAANRSGCLVAQITEDNFLVIESFDSPEEVTDAVNEASARFFSKVEEFNTTSGKPYYIDVNMGCSIVRSGWNESLAAFIKLAMGELYLNRLKRNATIDTMVSETNTDSYNTFNLLVRENLFEYHFQPIIDARTGEIYAYEALMRTTGGVKMSPFEILSIAKKYDRLYDIELATMNNVMERYSSNPADFSGRKIFINTIPGHFLNSEDGSKLIQKYGDHMGNFVYEVTEEDTISDQELISLRRLCKDGEVSQVAVDDYGTGHSNIVNLLRYEPQIIKIDRFLVTEIQNDVNKQMFVKNTIEFARLNHIKVLAEGVETSEELQKLIEFGVDLIQGYYTGKPALTPLKKLDLGIRNEIVRKNIMMAKYDQHTMVYTPDKNETVDLLSLAVQHYTHVLVKYDVELVSNTADALDLVICTEPKTNAVITLSSVSLNGSSEPTIQLAKQSDITLVLKGENVLTKDGIRVPESASLRITGNGNLTINATKNDGVGIGTNGNLPYGNITIDTPGHINISFISTHPIGIGGGIGTGSKLTFLRGTVDLRTKGIQSIGIGSRSGLAEIIVEKDAVLNIYGDGNNVVSIGSLNGDVDCTFRGILNVQTDGENIVGIGATSGHGKVNFESGMITEISHCNFGICIGTFSGSLEVTVQNAFLDIHAEGNVVCGIGSIDSQVDLNVEGGTIQLSMLCGERFPFGGEQCHNVINGGNILVENDSSIRMRNRFGSLVFAKEIDGKEFTDTFYKGDESYTYSAVKAPNVDRLCVFVPMTHTEKAESGLKKLLGGKAPKKS